MGHPPGVLPSEMRRATSPMRISPAVIIGLAANAPPDGLVTVVSSSPRAERRMSSWEVNGPWISATSTGPSCTPARSAARRVDADVVRSRRPRAIGSIRWSMPRIQAGRSWCWRATSPAANTTAATPSLIGGQSWRRSGATVSGSASRSAAGRSHASWALGLAMASRRLRAATSAMASTVIVPASSAARAWRAARLMASGQSGATEYGSSWRVITMGRSPGEDFA